jgi:hypothetical protein
MKSLKISLAVGWQAGDCFLEHRFSFKHRNLVLLLSCGMTEQGAFRWHHDAGRTEQWAFGKNKFSEFNVAFGEESLAHVRRWSNFLQV